MKQKLINLGCPEEKVRVVPHGVDLTLHQHAMSSDEGSFRVLMAARFTEKKGLVYGLQALTKLCGRYPNLKVTLVGDAKKGDRQQEGIRDELLAIANKLPASAEFAWLGERPLPELLQIAGRHHLFLQPSVTAESGDDEGGAPVTILHFAALGLPVVGTFHCDIPYLVENGKTGILVPERNSDALTEAIEELVTDSEKRKKMSHAAIERVRSQFSLDAMMASLEAVYDEFSN